MQKCPKQCIAMAKDTEGFLYPIVDTTICINCKACEKVCPFQHLSSERVPKEIYAAKNNSEGIRLSSSSGGIFTLLAEDIINQGGVVFGVKFDSEWNAIHDYSETKEGLFAFRGSKYIQSTIGKTYTQAQEFLNHGRKVLYSGTPCQIAGLYLFLQKKYENLTTVDFICHGTPSPKVWQVYLQERCNQAEIHSIETINFRHKKSGWKNYSFHIKWIQQVTNDRENDKEWNEPFNKNSFMIGFLKDLYLRPSCYKCPIKNFSSNSDFTLADYWGYNNLQPNFDDDKGISLVFIHSGKSIPPGVSMHTTTYEHATMCNPAVRRSFKPHPNRRTFFKKLGVVPSLSNLIAICSRPTLGMRIKHFVKKIIKR